jgi:hypothetical protein
VVATPSQRRFELPVGRVLGAIKSPRQKTLIAKAQAAVVAAPMVDEPGKDEGDEPDATDPHNVVPHHRVCDLKPDVSPSAAGYCEFAPVVPGRAF